MYTHLDTSQHEVDLQGWMDPNFRTVFCSAIPTCSSSPMTVIEVGSWKGLSTSHMAASCKEHKKEANIIAVDTWLGAPEFWTWGLHDPTRGGSLLRKHGYPHVYETFIKNMKALGHEDMVCPLPLTSASAYHVLKYYELYADIIYIDAAHEYESVKQDITTYWELLKPGGMMFGDDYVNAWPGVIQAVDEVFGKECNKNGIVWYAVKI